jgi:hypothetical protein
MVVLLATDDVVAIEMGGVRLGCGPRSGPTGGPVGVPTVMCRVACGRCRGVFLTYCPLMT